MKKTYTVEGMTCAACSSAVERIVRRQEGLESASVNLTTKKLTVEVTEGIFNQDLMVEKVKKAGFDVINDQAVKSIVMPIAGMT